MEYRKLNEETVVEQEVKEGIEGEIPAELELPEEKNHTREQRKRLPELIR
jgi:hypothetical protein